MVGIVLASHGQFAEGILQSGSMIFGEQENVAAVVLQPSEGPDDIKAKMESAISSFDDQDEILFLVDLWGGTPFNQASTLRDGNPDKSFVIVSGLNLPMLIEAYASRFSMESAEEIASHLIEVARDGVKTLPEGLMPVQTDQEVGQGEGNFTGAIPEGTVLGDGKIDIVLARIDSRLLHGQVATSWTKSTKPTRIIVVSDKVAQDELRKNMIEQAAPPGVPAHVVPIEKMGQIYQDPRFGTTRALLLFENPDEVVRAMDAGLELDEVNLGSLSHSTGKVAVNNVLSMGPEDVKAFDILKERGVKMDVRKVPSDSKANMENIINKARKGLNI